MQGVDSIREVLERPKASPWVIERNSLGSLSRHFSRIVMLEALTLRLLWASQGHPHTSRAAYFAVVLACLNGTDNCCRLRFPHHPNFAFQKSVSTIHAHVCA